MEKSAGIAGCIAAAVAIATGAFGAHALKDVLIENDRLDVWQTAVDYHMWHALALVLCAALPFHSVTKRVAEALFVLGILFFSGSLYWLALGGPSWLGPITPLGGLSFMSGWIALTLAIGKYKYASDPKS